MTPFRFHAPARYQWALPGAGIKVDGGLIPASSLTMPALRKRIKKMGKTGGLKAYPYLKNRLFDPQLYLRDLNPSTSASDCTKLATYPWFGASVSGTQFDSGKMTLKEWSDGAKEDIAERWSGPAEGGDIDTHARACVEFQMDDVDCDAVILPGPLIRDEHASFDDALAWIDAGIKAAQEHSVDALATIALSDVPLRGRRPHQNVLLKTILDQVTARDELAGVFLTIDHAGETGYFCSNADTVASAMWLVREFSRAGMKRIFFSGSGPLGLALCGLGATDWSCAWYRSERRLRIDEYEDDQMGLARPTFYSHPLAGDIHVKEDLEFLVGRGFATRIADSTADSSGLLTALNRRIPVSSVAAWRYRPSNVKAARSHFLRSAVRETATLNALDARGRRAHVANWLKGASALSKEIALAFNKPPRRSKNDRTEITHQSTWHSEFMSAIA